MTTPNIDLAEQIARELYRNDHPTHMGGWDHALDHAKRRYADRAVAVLPIVAEAVKAGKAEAWEKGKRDGMRQADFEYGARTLYIATNPYQEETPDEQ